MFDITVDDDNHRYYTNGILSHNSTTTRAFLLWQAIFTRDITIAILANKLALSMEQLQQLKESYSMLPYWMQPGLVEWNKKRVQFSNNTKVMCAATSTDGIRGLAINILYVDEFAFIPNYIANEFIASIFPTISSGQSTKIFITSCVTKDTMVFTDKGIMEVNDFIDPTIVHGGYEIPDYNVVGMNNKLNHGSIMHNEGLRDTRIITTAYTEAESSLNHRWWTCKNGVYDWVKTESIEVGDFVAVKYGMNCWGNDRIDFIDKSLSRKGCNRLGDIDTMTPDLAYLIGLYLSEGNARNAPGGKWVNITCGDDVSKAITNLGLRYTLRSDGLHYSISSTSLVLLLLHLGFDVTRHAPQKIIPSRLMRLSKECTAAMLQWIFDGDGCAHRTKSKISISLSSKRMIEQIRMILLNFGILSTYHYEYQKPTKKVNAWSHSYRLAVASCDGVKKFFDDIGFRFSRKQTLINLNNPSSREGTHHDVIPFSYGDIKQLKKSHKWLRKVFSFSGEHKRNKHFSRNKILRYKSMVSDQDISCKSFYNAHDNVIWCEVKSITPSRNMVYDFSLDDVENDGFCHSVAYNGLVGHQTPRSLNHFYDMWEKAKKGPGHKEWNKFIPKEIPWNAVPGRDEEWAHTQIQQIGQIRFNQEFLGDFIGSMSTLIDNNFLKTLLPVEPLVIPRIPEYVQIWELPKNPALMEQKNWEYVASLDASYGIRADSSVLKIYLVKSNITLHLVAQMSCNDMEIEDFCEQANTLLHKYNQPNLIIEMNGPGTAAMQFFHSKVEYENLLHFDPRGKMMGLWAGDKLKNAAVIMLKSYVQRKLIKDLDADTIAELYSFGKVSKEKWGAMSGNHDDHVMSMLWCIYYVNSPLFYGNVAEVNIAGMKNPDLILETADSQKEEDDVLANMSNPEFHKKELSDAAEHNPYDRDSDKPIKESRVGSRIHIYGEDEDDDDGDNDGDSNESYVGGFRA